MNVLLLGNGFDIYHNLPTKYQNFLLTVDFLQKEYCSDIKTVGDVFGTLELQTRDPFIERCYMKHQKVYDTIPIDPDAIKKMIYITKENIWFRYLLRSFDKDVGWIDFEKEIAFVLESFNIFLSDEQIRFNLFARMPEEKYRYIIIYFGDFLERENFTYSKDELTYQVKEEYRMQYPHNSLNSLIDKKKIIERLLKELDELAQALKLYLRCFVDNTLEDLRVEKCRAISDMDYIISFNYTNTYEKLYEEERVFHLHGDVDNRVILGVNPDDADRIESIDTSFVYFKKYFQRTLYETDTEYIKWLNDLKETREEISLIIMGHSLDVTDEDVLKELIVQAEEIVILYHNDEAKISYITNLIKMFGKKEFDNIRRNRKLRFLPLDMDFTEFAKERAGTSSEAYEQSIAQFL